MCVCDEPLAAQGLRPSGYAYASRGETRSVRPDEEAERHRSPTAITCAAVRAALARVLRPRGAAGTIQDLLRYGDYTVHLDAPSGGKLAIDWYHTPGWRPGGAGAGPCGWPGLLGRFAAPGRLGQDHPS